MTPAPIYRIHPAIGIARLGNSPDSFYIGPERTGAPPIDCGPDGVPITKDGAEQPVTNYKDPQNRIRRQAARFRIYVYDETHKDGRELKIGETITIASAANRGEIYTGELVDIMWTVYLANKKASWYEFNELQGEHGYPAGYPLRNADIQDTSRRQRLIIDPGPRSVSWKDPKTRQASFAKGGPLGTPESFPPDDIVPNPITTLGDLISTTGADGHNRLLVLGGMGNSGSAKRGLGEPSIQSFVNNDGWFDDTSDGPVNATLMIKVATTDGAQGPSDTFQSIPVDESAWVITGYPRYAPQITDIVTLDDAVYDVAVRNFDFAPLLYKNGQYNRDYYPHFWRDIWPILRRPFSYGFVMDPDVMAGGDPHQTGKGSGGNFDPDLLAIPPQADDDPQTTKNNTSRRMFLYNVLRKPGRENRLYADAPVQGQNFFAMPLLCGDNPITNDLPSKFLRLTDTMLFLLQQWAEGKFVNETLEDFPASSEAEAVKLDRGVLGNGLGGSFCPGGEVSWIIRNPAIYKSGYRINAVPSPLPGSLSQPGVVSNADTTANLGQGLEPGDLTKYSGVPWQADFNECTTQDIDVTYETWNQVYAPSTGDTFQSKVWVTYWWPAHRPDFVGGASWAPAPSTYASDLAMVSDWWKLGFVVPASNWTADTPAFQLSENQLGG